MDEVPLYRDGHVLELSGTASVSEGEGSGIEITVLSPTAQLWKVHVQFRKRLDHLLS